MRFTKTLFSVILLLLVACFITIGCKDKEEYVTVTFDSNGGTEVKSLELKKNDKIGTLPETNKDEYIFIGWFTELNNGAQIHEDYIVKDNITLYAHFDKEDKYATVTFDSNGGTEVKPLVVKKGEKIGTLPETVKENHIFLGWFIGLDESEQVNASYIVRNNITLYAHFEEKQEEYVTIVFDTDGGTNASPMTIKKGEKIGSLPFTDKIGYSFLGWYLDKSFNNQICDDDVINDDITLYACFEKQAIDTVLPEFTEVSLDSEDSYFKFQIRTDKELTEQNIDDYIGLSNLYGSLPKLKIVKDEDIYTITPIGGYQKGGVYTFRLLDEAIYFYNLNQEYEDDIFSDEQIRTINVSILGDEVETIKYKEGIIEIPYNKIDLSQDLFLIDEDMYILAPFEVNSIVHITDDNLENDFYVKVLETEKVNNNKVSIKFEDCDVNDVLDDFDLNSNNLTAINNRILPENKEETDLMLQDMVDKLYDSEGTASITYMLAQAINASPTYKRYASNGSLSPSYSDKITDKTGISISVEGLLENLKITATLGSAKNPNFNGIFLPSFNEDRWTMLELKFDYEGTINNKVKLEASITITQYIYVWFSFNADSRYGDFKVEATPLSQTDIEFKVLICSTDGEEDDKKDDNKKEEKKDISIEISNLIDGNGDSSNIIKDVQDMLENKGDDIELCKVPLFQASYVAGGIISINFDLNFVIKVCFAAGVKIEASVLEATTIGVTGNYKTKSIDVYKRAAKGSDRYIFDFYAYGYLGVKAGIEGELTVSFIGLKKALRAGVSVEIGAYADLYGYLHYHAEERRVYKDVDTNGRHFQTLEGGVYFEMGIYIELKAFVGVGKKEYGISKEFKFKLLEAGDKYLYVEPMPNEDLKIIFRENDDDTLDLEEIIPAEGKFLNIVTGDVETRTIPAKNIRIVSKTNLFKTDNENKSLIANHDKLDLRNEGISSGKIELYYKGPNILFSSKSLGENISELKGFKMLTEITVYYVRKGVEIDDENIGKEVTVTYQVQEDDKLSTVKTITLLSGQYINGGIPEELTYYLGLNGLLWDTNESDGCSYDGPLSGKHMITENQTYTFKTSKALGFVGIKYMNEKNEWIFEVYAYAYDEIPELLDKHLRTNKNEYVQYNISFKDGTTYPMGNSEYLSRYDTDRHGTYGYKNGEMLATVSGTKEEVDAEIKKMYNNEGKLSIYNKYFIYSLQAEYTKGVLEVIYYDDFGNYSFEYIISGKVFAVPTYWINNINNTQGIRLVGWDTNDDGFVDILPEEEFVVTDNMILKPITTSNGYIITITDIEGKTTSYTVNYNEKIPQSILDIINNDPYQEDNYGENSFLSESYWRICTSDFVTGKDKVYFNGISTGYSKDIEIMPSCDLSFTAVKGDLYHYVTFTDETGGHFEKDGENFTSIKIAVKDGSSVGYSKDFDKVQYVYPEETELRKYVYYFLQDENGENLNYYNDIITTSKEYHVVWWKTIENSFNIEFVIKTYDDYGNIISEVNKHNHTNILKNEYDKLVEKYNEEYEYYQSTEYLNSLSDSTDYIYSIYMNGDLNINSEFKLDFYERTKRYYCVSIRRNTRKFTITINWNSNPIIYPEQITTENYNINTLYPCPESDYSYVGYDDNGYEKLYYFIGFDIDGDGIVDIKAGEKFILREDINLTACWE